ncbi:MAG TPA: phospholipid carrier-dependent glycosyltransferase, partial [Thermoanaerobaculia bacterium]|nr:phospholipid carrier-dependent glycosyltransferase [Thermoanaerobaculia bacterium]
RFVAGWREALVLALGGAAVLAVAFTVIPSLFAALRFGVVATCWSLACLGAGLGAAFARSGPWPLDCVGAGLGAAFARFGRWPLAPRLPRRAETWLELGTIVLLLLLTLVVAALSVPRVYDALAYHVPRVFFWIQNHSAAFYPTPEPRQNYISPFTAYATVQLMLLHDRDWAPLVVQWTAYLGLIVTATLVADELGARPATRTLVAALVATIPNLALQAQTALTDVVTAFWTTAAVWAMLRARREASSRGVLGRGALVGTACGLAVLAKASSYFFLFPFAVWWLLRRGEWRRRLAEVAVAGSAILALNGYHYAQAQLAYGNPLSSAGHVSYLNASFTPQAMAGSLLEHTSAHLLLPVTTAPVRIELGDRWNRGVERAVRGAERLLGVDPEADNLPPGTTYSLSLDGPTPPPVANSPQSSGSPLHFVLGTAAVVLALLRRGAPVLLRAYASASLGGFLLLTMAFRWQPWIGRFHLSYLVLAAVLLATTIAALPSRFGARWWRVALVTVLAAYTATMTVLHQEHDLRTVWTTPRSDLHLQAELVRPLAERLGHLETIGILAPPNVIEYPFLRALRDSAPRARVMPVFAELPWRGGVRRSADDPQGILLVTQYREPSPELLARLRRARYREVLANPMGRAFVQRRRDQ